MLRRGFQGTQYKSGIRNEMVAYEHDQMEEICNQALGILKSEGDIGDTLNEIREKWSEGNTHTEKTSVSMKL